MSSTLEKVITALTQAGITKQDFEQRDPKGVALKYIEDYLAPEINQRISTLLTSTDLKPGEIFELHRSVVNYLNSVGYKNFKLSDIEKYENGIGGILAIREVNKFKYKIIEYLNKIKVMETEYRQSGRGFTSETYGIFYNSRSKDSADVRIALYAFGEVFSFEDNLSILSRKLQKVFGKKIDASRLEKYLRLIIPKSPRRLCHILSKGGYSVGYNTNKIYEKIKTDEFFTALSAYIDDIEENFKQSTKKYKQELIANNLPMCAEEQLNLFLRGRIPIYNPINYKMHFDTWKKGALKEILRNLP